LKDFGSRDRAVVAVLAFVAGYVDATAFLASQGYFVSFMSGNSTRLGVGLVTRASFALTALGIIAAFLSGVTLAALAARTLTHNRPHRLLYAIATLIATAAASAALGYPSVTLTMLAAAMGAENLLYERDGEVRFGLTYMTGALVRIGLGIGTALSGGPRWAWLPYLRLWVALVAGCAAGATLFGRFGYAALWLAALTILLVALVHEQWKPTLRP
jgi:uncharacterized membrane protein YoaK (UPF0700 family)